MSISVQFQNRAGIEPGPILDLSKIGKGVGDYLDVVKYYLINDK